MKPFNNVIAGLTCHSERSAQRVVEPVGPAQPGILRREPYGCQAVLRTAVTPTATNKHNKVMEDTDARN